MPRKKARLSHKKKSVKKEERQAPGGLSQQQFAALPLDFGSFEIEDSNHEQHKFVLGDVVYVQHQELSDDKDVVPAEDYWIGEIKEIRANSSHNVWVQVQWFWSPQEVAEVIKSFDPTVCGRFEKLASNNCDVISVHAVVDHVEVKHFDETSIYQVLIEDDEWFARYEFLYDSKRISPKVTHRACSICKIPYTPGEVKVHHFCPRPSCRTLYHQSCLVKNGYVQTPSHKLLETWPDIDRTATMEEICSDPPTKRLKKGHSPSSGTEICDKDPISDIPARLLEIAEQPIVRGTLGGGVVGNLTSVSTARSLIYRFLSGSSVIPDDWESKVDISAALLETDSFPNCFCPSCYSPI